MDASTAAERYYDSLTESQYGHNPDDDEPAGAWSPDPETTIASRAYADELADSGRNAKISIGEIYP